MLNKFLRNIEEKSLCNKQQYLLLAVSGGIDSVVMTNLFYRAGYKIALAHCNFGLRGQESLNDEKFVINLAQDYNLKYFVKRFKTKTYSQKNKLSIQEAARHLRYEWFEQIRKTHHFDAVATAHHADDQIETFFINLFRKTGIKGLTGIPEKQNYIIRPMLCFSRKEIETYAKENKIKFLNDSSNEEDKYVRNKIRHQLIPIIQNIQPEYIQNITETIQNLKNTEILYRDFLQRFAVLRTENNRIYLSIEPIVSSPAPVHLLYEYINPFGFNVPQCKDIIDSAQKSSGKKFFSETHRLIKDRKFFIIEHNSKKTPSIFFINEGDKKKQSPLRLRLKTLKTVSMQKVRKSPPQIAFLDKDKLHFPLVIRNWKKGDVFYPFGLRGKKKLSDFFSDKKFSLFDKENTWLLCSGEDIVWVIGHRIDERYKITPQTKNILMIEQI